mgnify:CR=1 FL=1
MRAGNLPLAMRIYDRGRNEDFAVKSAGHGYCLKVWRTFTPPGSIQRPGYLGLRFGSARISNRQTDAEEFGIAIPTNLRF